MDRVEFCLQNLQGRLLDVGYSVGGIHQKFIEKFLLGHLENILKRGEHIDAKSKLQELAQDKMMTTPVYKLISEEGPDHDKIFTMGATIGDRVVGP